MRYYPVETPGGWVVALCAVSSDECATVLTEKGAREWADRLNGKSEALCPRCGGDIVLPPGFPFEWANRPECGLNGGEWEQGCTACSEPVSGDIRLLREALRVLYETSGKVPLKPSDADDATLLAFIRARREAHELLDTLVTEPEARIQADSVTPAETWTLTEQSPWIRPYYVVHAKGDVDKMGRVFFDKELARKYRDSWVNATYVVERHDPDGTSCIEP